MVGGRAHNIWGRRLQAAVALAACTTLVAWTLVGKEPAYPAHLMSHGQSKVRIGWVGHLFGERPPSGLTVKEAQRIATDNSGNLVWAYAARQLVDPNATELVPLVTPPYNTPVDVVLLPTANLLMNASKYSAAKNMKGYTGMLLNIVKAATAPIAVIGIGSQVGFDEVAGQDAGKKRKQGADYAASSGIVLHQQQVELLQVVQASGGLVTTRGKFTEAIFAANGVAPPLPLGCPSLFLNHNPQLGAALQRKWDTVLEQRSSKLRVAVTMPAIPGNKPYPEALTKMLTERVFKAFPNSVAVLQTQEDANTLTTMRVKHGLCLGEGRVRYFYDVESWVDGLKACCDFVFGFRIHGTMAGLAAEVPGVVISRDYRIKELADSMLIPTIDILQANLDPDTFDLFDFIKSVPSYGARFDARRREVARVYASEFERLKVPLHPGIASIASLPEP